MAEQSREIDNHEQMFRREARRTIGHVVRQHDVQMLKTLVRLAKQPEVDEETLVYAE